MRKRLFAVLIASLFLAPLCFPMSVSAATVYIYDVDDLQDMDLDLAGDYELANNIDASATSGWNGGAGFEPVGDAATPFTGTLDGQGYVISDLYINRSGTALQGLFGVCDGTIGDHVTLSNIILIDASITGSNTLGILCARADDYVDITGCYSTGTLTGDTQLVGGLVGHFYSGTVTMTRCASTASVTGEMRLGGLVGQAIAGTTITNCYARGSVSIVRPGLTGFDGGGLVGAHSGTITNSYSTGLVSCTAATCDDIGGLTGDPAGSATNSFWDTETSGQATSGAGTGKTTTEMKTESTFTGAGWDFTTIWDMQGVVNSGYPFLQWWYDPSFWPGEFDQVLWFQPNAIIQGTTLPDRMENEDGIITWGANPAGITISYSGFEIEQEYDFEPVVPGTRDIIKPEPADMTTDVDLVGLERNPLHPLVQTIASVGGFTERLVWLGLAWLILIAAMLLVHLGPDTHKDSDKPQHFVLTTLTGLGLSIVFFVMGIFPLWVPIVLGFGFVASIIYERMPVL